MVLGKLPVPGRPPNLDKNRARAYCSYSGRIWVLIFLSSVISLLSPFLRQTARYRQKYCLKVPLNTKTTSPPIWLEHV